MSYTKPEGVTGLAQGKDKFSFKVDSECSLYGDRWWTSHNFQRVQISISWEEIFLSIAPRLLGEKRESYLKTLLNSIPQIQDEVKIKIKDEYDKLLLNDKINNTSEIKYTIVESDFQTIKIQLLALGLITLVENQTSKGSKVLNAKLTPYGNNLMFRLKAVKK